MKRICAALLCLFLLVSAGCERKEKEPPNANKTFTYQFDADPRTLDPQVADDSASILAIEALFEGLVRLDQDGQPTPGVAESWTHNSDYTQFTFQLRSDAVWVDYVERAYPPVTAHDFVYAWRRAVNPATKSATSGSMLCIQNAGEIRAGSLPPSELGVAAANDKTLVVTLAYPYQDFPALTASTPYMPCNEAFFEQAGGRYGLDRKYLMGNGPFVIDGLYGWDHEKHLNLTRSARYAGAAKPLPMSVEFPIKKSDDTSDPLTALTKGTVDVTALSAQQLGKAQEEGCSIVSFEDTTWGLCFNTQGEQMKSESLRRALVHALDREQILTHIPAGMNPAEDILAPSTTFQGGLYREKAGGGFYERAGDDAAALFSAALGELQETAKTFSPAKVLCLEDDNVKLLVNEMIVSWNRTFDRNFNMEPVSREELLTRVRAGDYELAVLPIQPSASGPQALLNRFQSASEDNSAKLNSPAYDSLLIQARQSIGQEAVENYAQAERYLNSSCIFYPLYYESHYYGLAKGVTGVIIHPYSMGIDFRLAGKE